MSYPRQTSVTFTNPDFFGAFITPAGVTMVDIELQGDSSGDFLRFFDIQVEPNGTNGIAVTSGQSNFQRSTDGLQFIAYAGGGATMGYIKVSWYE